MTQFAALERATVPRGNRPAPGSPPDPLPGTLLLRGVVGSTAYGLAHESSDHDWLGCYAVSTEVVLGLDGYAAVSGSHVTKSPDQTLHEVGKFVSLALVTNPTVSELLWLPEYETLHPAGQLLVEHREKFLSDPYVRSAYGGYATQQARKLLARDTEGKSGFGRVSAHRVRKHGRHCFRLMLQAAELLSTGTLTLDVSAHRDRLFAMGELAATDPGRFTQLFEAEHVKLQSMPSVLPQQADRAAASDLLVAVRRSVDSPGVEGR